MENGLASFAGTALAHRLCEVTETTSWASYLPVRPRTVEATEVSCCKDMELSSEDGSTVDPLSPLSGVSSGQHSPALLVHSDSSTPVSEAGLPAGPPALGFLWVAVPFVAGLLPVQAHLGLTTAGLLPAAATPLSSAAASPPKADVGALSLARCLPPPASSSTASASSACFGHRKLQGRVWNLSRDERGCRVVQEALDKAGSEEERLALAVELRGHVAEGMRCAHANHVLQKCIRVLRPENLQFMVDEVVGKGADSACQAARHKYGCRIVQRLLEHCAPAQVHELIEQLLSDAVTNCLHPFGTYVMQHILEQGFSDQRRRLAQVLKNKAAAMGRDSAACAVLAKAMTVAVQEDRVAIARSLVEVPNLVDSMMQSKHGMYAGRLAQEVIAGISQKDARSGRASLHGGAAAHTKSSKASVRALR